ncbi:MAG: C_GCAxxG_C_C family protein [Bacteroidales bacterium]|nr:C_GCAxxG_C_C family protein [Bacteroidales bacterium]
MNKSSEALKAFDSGFNCAQSMLHTYGKEFFREEASALKLASGFGAGVSYRGEMCGAVSGSLMVIGLHYGYSDLTMELQKDMNFLVAREFMTAFEQHNGSLVCNQLVKSEINTPEGLEFARQNGLFNKTCPGLIASAAEILESLLEKYPVEKMGSKL